ncbi:preprotein translocase subunit SecG [Aestuariibacter sp. A3R04]|uniref:preprotein translocase subunit SecG n=1 Tax=Aestuariibacter sp. A3R04 TaxID=2841571 RepID=UPI001C099EF2|nr:preprotein translocase subunit SecG [Aestuariibacter sp. A3R04]MBU3023020.1 preprotein translocase subunit SecG [Aestuariibacter sp. A3R04]
MLYEVLLVAYLIVALMLIGFVLIQQGKGANMGASFGGGGSNTVFGSSGSGNFMTKTTSVLATLFFVLSLFLGNITANTEKAEDGWDDLSAPVVEDSIPVVTESEVNSSDVPSVEVEDVPVTDNQTDDVPN